MSNIHITLPQSLHEFVDQQATESGHASVSAYIEDLIIREKDKQALRNELLSGKTSGAGPEVNSAYFQSLRKTLI